MKNKQTLWMSPFIPAEKNLPVINLSCNISNSLNSLSFSFTQQLERNNLKKIVGIKNADLETNLKNKIRQYLKITSSVNNDNMIFGFGSYSIIEKLAWKLLPKGLMIGEFPQFWYFPMEYILAGGKYQGIWTTNFSFPYQKIINLINQSKTLKIIYINNPNNPTGKTVPVDQILSVLKKAKKKKVIVIVDEVYSDLLPVKNSLSSYVNQYNNLIVLRSFSKIFGIQDLRLGFMISGKKLINNYKKICNWNEIENISALLGSTILQNKKYQQKLKKECQLVKPQTIKLFKQLGYKIINSNPLVPLIFIKSSKNIDLEEFFRQKNIIVKGSKRFSYLYKNFPQNYARIRIPTNNKDLQQLKNRLL